MTEQTARNEWAAPARSPYQADPDWYDPHPAEHRTADTDASPPGPRQGRRMVSRPGPRRRSTSPR
jgi:hypothetical protein